MSANLRHIRGISFGYSIIELLVVISIMIIIFTLGLANYKNFSQKQKLENIASQIKGDLRLAQEYASGARKTGVCTELHGYTFSRNGSSRYEVRQNCDANACNAGDVIKSITLPTGITLSNFSCFRFNVLGRGTDRSGDIVITVNLANSSYTKNVTITKYGEIK